MTGEGRAAACLGLSFILLPLALGGWGAFAYSLYSAHHDARFLSREVGRLTAERQQTTSDLKQMAGEVTKLMAEQGRNLLTIERLQADLIVARAEVAATQMQPPHAAPQPRAPAPAVSPPSRWITPSRP